MHFKVKIQNFTTEIFWKQIRLFNTNIDFIFKRTKLYCENNESGIFTTKNNPMRRILARAEPASDTCTIVRRHLYGLRLINYRAI